MIFKVPENIQLWEALALIQIVQQLNIGDTPASYVALSPDADEDIIALFHLAGVGAIVNGYDGEKEIELTKAYLATVTADTYYGEVLASTNGLQVTTLSPPKFPYIKPREKKNGIVVCPFGMRPEFDIPIKIWKDVIKQLESYDSDVYVLGDRRQRLDELSFTENEILSDLPLSVKLQMLASAKVVVGVANAWTWLSSAWPLRRILLHPDNVRNDRWYPALDNSVTKFLLHNPEILSSPVVLVGIRKLMRELP